MQNDFAEDINSCLKILNDGGTILYPTDTIWGIGCNAAAEKAVGKIFQIKKRTESKSMIVLIDDEKKLTRYVRHLPPQTLDLISQSEKPLTIIFDGAQNLAPNIISKDGSVAIRIVKDKFCKELISRFGKPIVSTSANISGENPPKNFKEISPSIIQSVDYVVKYRQDDLKEFAPSKIIRLKKNGETEVIRE